MTFFAFYSILSADKNIYFYPIDYDENIFEDPEYLAQNHYFIYTENDTSTYMINDSDYLEGGLPVAMFRQYFDAIINGDSETGVTNMATHAKISLIATDAEIEFSALDSYQ